MEKLEKILSLLEKKHLTSDEKKIIADAELQDSEVREILSLHNKLDDSLTYKLHHYPDLIADIVLFENDEDPEDSSVKHIYLSLKNHIENCEVCKEEYELSSSEYRSAKEHVYGKQDNHNVEPEKKSFIFSLFIFRQVRYAFTAFVILFFMYGGLYFYSSSNIPEYKKSILSEDASEFHATRGRTSVLFQKSMNAISKNETETAIEYLKQDINENPNDRSIFYSYYILGVLQLKNSEEDFIGLFSSFNEDKVREAVQSLKTAISLNNSGDYFNITLEIHYYLGRAYLLIDDFEHAESHFNIVINYKGKYYPEAEKMIELMREYEK